MTRIALVFRSIDERTSDLSLALAKKNIQPDEIHIFRDCRPFTETVRRMVEIDYTSDFVVAVDADSLIFEDMRPWLETNRQAYVDSYVNDRFRGRLHCGVHITRRDVMDEMKNIEPPVDDEAYVLRPESRLRKLAMNRLGYTKSFRSFQIFHDHHQWLRDVWAKYALRELRSRTIQQRHKLEAAIARWEGHDEVELRVARAAVGWSRSELREGTSPADLSAAIAKLQTQGKEHVARLGFEEHGPLEEETARKHAKAHMQKWPTWNARHKVFGLGLSRTGTRSLTAALHILGIDTVHYPIDADSLRAMTSGALDFQLLESFDGITDITVSPYYAQLEQQHPDAKFILTLREPVGWQRSCKNHWTGRDAFAPTETAGAEIHMKTRRFLRAATYGTYNYMPERFQYVYDQHVAAVRRYFADKPGKLIELDIVGGQGWDVLCPFLDRPVPDQPFPRKGGALSAKLRRQVDDPDD